MNTNNLPSMLGQIVNGFRITSELYSIEEGTPIAFRYAGPRLIQRDVIEQPAPIKKTGPGHFNSYAALTAYVKSMLNDYMRGGACFQIALGACLDFCPTKIMAHTDAWDMICRKGHTSHYWRSQGIRPWSGTKDPTQAFMDEVCGQGHEDGTRRKATRIKIDKSICTLNRLAKRYPSSRVFVGVDGHCVALIDGDIYDHTYKKGRRVEWAWLIEEI